MRESFRGNPSLQEECELCGGQGGRHAPRCLKVTSTEGSGVREIPTDRIRTNRGTEFEKDVFGAFDVTDPAYQAELKKVLRPGHNGKMYGERQPLIDLIKRFQPATEGHGATSQFLEDVRLELAEISGEEAEDAVRTFTAVGTPLDVLHGIDAFVTVNADGKEELVTLDATLDAMKASMGAKADVMIGEFPDPNQDEDAYLANVSRIAEKIYAVIRDRKKKKDNVYRIGT